MKDLSDKKPFRPLQEMFMAVPHRYDLLNRLLTLCFDNKWRKITVKKILEKHPKRILDICTGTGDLALRIAKNSDGDVQVHGLDFSKHMLELAEQKAARLKISGVQFQFGAVSYTHLTLPTKRIV